MTIREIVRHLWDHWRLNFKDADQREIWEYIHDEGELPSVYAVPGKFDITSAPFAREVFQALKSPLKRDVSVMSGVQCLKTLIGELWQLWSIRNDPGSMQWLQCTDDEGKEHMEERVIPLIQSFPAVQAFYGQNRHNIQKTFLQFKHGYWRIEGINNPKNLNRKSIKKQMRSEVWMRDYWIPGKIKEASSRQTQYLHNSKAYTESQAGWIIRNEEDQIIGDDWLLYWLQGTQKIWSFPCQACRKFQPYDWDFRRPDGTRAAMRWDDTERTRRPDGTWRWGELIQTIRYECIYCGERHYDDPVVRRRMSDNSKYVSQLGDSEAFLNPHESFSWNQLCILNLPWFETKQGGVKNYLIATDQYKKGNHALLQEFQQKVLAKSWDEARFAIFTKLPIHEITSGPDPEGKHWEKQDFLFMKIDVQLDHFWYLITAFSKDGEFQVLDFGKKYNWEDLREVQLKWGVRDQDVGCDCSHRQTEVWWHCVHYGHEETIRGKRVWFCWHSLRGTDEVQFIYVAKIAPGKTKKYVLPYSWPPQRGDPCIGLRSDDPRRKTSKGRVCHVYAWSNPTIKDVAKNLRDAMAKGQRGSMRKAEWNDEFSKQMYSESKRLNKLGRSKWEVIGKRDNHGWDCFCMTIVDCFKKRIFLHTGSGDAPQETNPPAAD